MGGAMIHPDEDALVTALDGTNLGVTVDLDDETVRLVIGELAEIDLTDGAALKFAEQITAAVAVLRRGDDPPAP